MDLTTTYLGLELSSPIVPNSSPLMRSLDSCRAMEDAGAGAIVLHSLFEEAVSNEQETMTRFLHHQEIGHAEASSYLPEQADFEGALERYLSHLQAVKQALSIPVIASLNGTTPSGWLRHAKALEAVGADALELNVYYLATEIELSPAEVEERYLELLGALRQEISIPINMKLGPWFSSLGNLLKRVEAYGAKGVSLFNRFYQPDIDIESLSPTASLQLSNSSESLLAMRWIAILYKRTGLSLGATTGIHSAEDAIKMLLAGADVVHLASALLQHGPGQVRAVLEGIEEWMSDQGFESITEVRGRVSRSATPDPTQFERANYIRVLDSYSAGSGVRV